MKKNLKTDRLLSFSYKLLSLHTFLNREKALLTWYFWFLFFPFKFQPTHLLAFYAHIHILASQNVFILLRS